MSMREVGTCRNEPCRQLDLVWEDRYCCDSCREEATGCDVPFCGCAGGSSPTTLSDPPSTQAGSP
jgi:hypothetical protein